MRVGFDVAQTCSPKAGCGWLADLLAKALAENAPEVHFDLYHQFGTLLNTETSLGTTISRPNVSEPFRELPVAAAKELWAAVAADQRELPGGPDIVHANCFRSPRVGSAKLVYTVYDMSFWIHPEFTTEINRMVCQEGTLEAVSYASGLFFISENTRAEFDRLFPGVCERRSLEVAVAPLASRFPTTLNPRSEIPSGGWLAVGSLEPRKNYGFLLDALERYWQRSKTRRTLTIAGGTGWKSEALRQRIQDLEQRGLVHYRGYVSEEELLQLYDQSFALLFPSHYEGFGLPIVEAMSRGCPVITRRNSSLQEVGGSAALYYDDTTDDPVDQMIRLESELELYFEESAMALSQGKRFDWNTTAEKVLELYRRISK
jgi:glycosyltransferase involved in cell wall biosynthesis